MQALTRRTFIQSAAAVGALATITRGADELPGATSADKSKSSPDPWHGLKLGVASYTLRLMKLDDALAAIQRVGLKYVSIKDSHLPMKSTPEERKAVAAKCKDAGITVLSCGVVGMKNNDEAACRAAFEYARDLGVPTMVCDPHPDSMPILDKLVKEFDIKLAIHNHGPDSPVFKSPYDVMKVIENHDQRIGLCIDVGHTARAGVDPAEAIHKCAARLYDAHLKDEAVLERKNNPVEIGRGVMDIRAIVKALVDVKFNGHAGIEYEKDAKDPLPGLAESVGYLRGVMGCLA